MSNAWVLVAPCVASLCCYGLACCLAVWWRIAARRPRGGRSAAGLTVFKPLCGVDEGLEANLASFFTIDHAPLQLVFAAADPGDPALAVVRRLMRRFPGRDVAIVVGADDTVPNPKVALLERMLPHARHGVILLSDSNVRLRDGEVGRVLREFDDERVGMVYQPVIATGERTVPAAVENMHYTEYAALLTIGARLLAGQHTVNGKGQWVRRAALDDVDCFARVRDRGADDYELALQVAAAGWELRMAGECVQVVQRDWSWSSLAARNLRHAGLRWRICPAAYPLELLFNPIPWSLPLLASGSRPLAIMGAAAVVAKILLEVSVARLLRGGPLAGHFVPVILVKDLYVFGCWFVALFARTAAWRGRLYRLSSGGRIEPAAPAPPAPELARAA
jgi:ceramide glucosyltransferase